MDKVKLLQERVYPQIENAMFNPRIIKILKNLAFGKQSELTAISEYTYQHWVLRPINSTVADLLEQISIEEMRHLELLADATLQFGGNPNYTDGNNMPWSARCLSGERNIYEILRQDIAGEQMAVSAYTRAASEVENDSLSALLTSIAENEMEHVRLLQNALFTLNPSDI